MKVLRILILTLPSLLLFGCGVSHEEHEKVKNALVQKQEQVEKLNKQLSSIQETLLAAQHDLKLAIQQNTELVCAQKLEEAETAINNSELDSAQNIMISLSRQFPAVSESERFKNLFLKFTNAKALRDSKPDFEMSAAKFWPLTFDNNEVKANKLYHNKRVRLTAPISSINSDAIFLYVGKNTFNSDITLMAILSKEYEVQLEKVLPSLETGVEITVEGIFDLKSRSISESKILNPITLKPIDKSNIALLRKAQSAGSNVRTASEWWPILNNKSMYQIRELFGAPDETRDNDQDWGYYGKAFAPNSGKIERLDVYFRGGVVKGVSSPSLDSIIQD